MSAPAAPARSPLSPSSGRASSPLASARAPPPILAEDVAKVELAILPLVPTSEVRWLCAVLAAPHAAVFAVAYACVRRLSDGSLKVDGDELAHFGGFRSLALAGTRFGASLTLSDRLCKILRVAATIGRADAIDARRDAMVRAGVVPVLASALRNHGEATKSMADNACGAVQGLAMGSEDRKDLLAEHPTLLPLLVATARRWNGLLSAKSAIYNIYVGEAGSQERRVLVVRAGGSAMLEKPT